MNLKGKIGLGTVQFGVNYGISNINGKTSPNEVAKILEYAKFEDIDILDSANAYGDSESVIGLAGVEKFNVISKYLPEKDSQFSIEEQLQISLRNLRLNSIYGYLAHKPKDVLMNPSQWNKVRNLKESGFVHKIGFSLNDPKELVSLIEIGIKPDIIQVPFNYLDRRFESLMEELHSDGVEVHSRSTFLQGLFFRDPTTLPSHFNEVKNIIREIKDSTEDIASSLLRFVLEKKFIDKVIIGVESKLQLKENIESLNKNMTLHDKSFNISDSILIPSNWP